MFNRQDYDFIRAVKADIMDNARIQSHDPQMIGIVRQVPVQLLHKVPWFHRHPRVFCQVMKIFDFWLWWLLYLYLVFRFCASVVHVACCKRFVLPAKDVRVIFADVVGLYFHQLVENAGMVDLGGNVVIQFKRHFPQFKREYGVCVHYLRLLRVQDCLSVLPMALRQVSLVRRCCGRQNTLHAAKAYEWLLYRKSLLRACPCREVVTMSENDRWYFLMQTLPARIALLQHGVLSKGDLAKLTPYRQTSVDRLMCYNREEELAFREFIRRGVGEVSYFTPRICLSEVDRSRPTVLLICNVLYYAQLERDIVQYLVQNFPSVQIYVKPHPAHPMDSYGDMERRYRCRIVTDPFFYPATDVVVAYHSSLASQYEAAGIVPIYMSDLDEKTLLGEIDRAVGRKL